MFIHTHVQNLLFLCNQMSPFYAFFSEYLAKNKHTNLCGGPFPVKSLRLDLNLKYLKECCNH